MVVQLTPAGLLFGADRNITSELRVATGSSIVVVSGQSERPKVLKWPNHEVIVGYVGNAELDGLPADVWLYDFIGGHLQFKDLQELADALTADLNALFRTFSNEVMVLHLGGFEMYDGQWTPRVYYVHNHRGMKGDEYLIGTRFTNSDEIPKYFPGKSGDQIRADLVWPQYFGFRQGIKLKLFNTIDTGLRSAMQFLVHAGEQPAPATLDDLVQYVKFQIHGYEAYFASFYPPFQQYVGGGEDVVTAAWP
jgi:hypothetical protein